MADDVAARWLISGVVQGVGFRWFVARHAESLKLRGWVRNLADGRVEVVAAGAEADMRQLQSWLDAGPRFARVERVEKSDIPHEDICAKSFEIN